MRTLLVGEPSLVLLFVIVPSFPDSPGRDPGVSLVDARFPTLGSLESTMYEIHGDSNAIPRRRSITAQGGSHSVSLRLHIRGRTTEDDETIFQSTGAPAKSGIPSPATISVFWRSTFDDPAVVIRLQRHRLSSPDSLRIENVNIPPPSLRSCGCKPIPSNNSTRNARRLMLFVLEMKFLSAGSHDPPFPGMW